MANSYHSWRTGVQIDNFYPIGSIYLSINNTNPHDLFGGTWEQIQDTFLLAAGSTYTAGLSGGSATINIAHSHTTNATTTGGTSLSIANMPSHNHGSAGGHTHIVMRGSFGCLMLGGGSGSGGGSITNWQGESVKGWTNSIGTDNPGGHTHTSQGSGTAHSHSQVATGTDSKLSSTQSVLPPYLVVYMWKRIS